LTTLDVWLAIRPKVDEQAVFVNRFGHRFTIKAIRLEHFDDRFQSLLLRCAFHEGQYGAASVAPFGGDHKRATRPFGSGPQNTRPMSAQQTLPQIIGGPYAAF
jgi:hypothetical protein